MTKFSMTMILASAATFSFGTAQAATLADPYTSFVSFGDSLTDQTNAFNATNGAVPAPPYVDGRFSNGPIWIDAVEAAFGAQLKPTFNFAFGGAKAVTDLDDSPDFQAQLGFYAGSGAIAAQGANPLGSVFFGGNDLYTLGSAPDPTAAGTAVAQNLGATVDQLVALGVNDIALWNAPDVSLTPQVTFFDAANAANYKEATDAFNAQIMREATRLRGAGVTVFEIDMASLFADLFEDPAQFGITNTTTPCLSATFEVCANPDQTAFFDTVHPNSKLHGFVADTFAATLTPTPVPLPASALLLLAGLGALGVARRAAK